MGADVVSGGELAKTLRAGVPAERIVFSGVGKTRDEIRAALAAGIRSINAESADELQEVGAQARDLGVVAPISVRLNPDVAAETHDYLATGAAASKFGLEREAAVDAVRAAAEDEALAPVGLSFHVGSQLLDPTPVLDAAGRAAELWRQLADEGIALRDFDAGGGIGIAYDEGPGPDLAAFVDPLMEVARGLDATLVLEPGRYLVAPAGVFVTRVHHVKHAGGRTIVVCDGGSNDLIRPALYGAEHPLEVLADGQRDLGRLDVVGPLCESSDFLALDRTLPVPRPGDLIRIRLAGAYGRVMSSTYNARPLCAEILLEAGGWRLGRERGSYEDLVRNERL
jgi:diaminopimelate decarboxylase